MSWEGGTFPDPCDCEHTMVQWEEGMPRMWKPGTCEQETLVHAPDCEACWAIDVFVINAGHRDPMGPVASLQGQTKPVAA